jgi:hypothetical protein
MSALEIARRKRYEAARARRMALYLANGDKRALCAYAEELEAEADRIESAGDPPPGRSWPANSC